MVVMTILYIRYLNESKANIIYSKILSGGKIHWDFEHGNNAAYGGGLRQVYDNFTMNTQVMCKKIIQNYIFKIMEASFQLMDYVSSRGKIIHVRYLW